MYVPTCLKQIVIDSGRIADYRSMTCVWNGNFAFYSGDL